MAEAGWHPKREAKRFEPPPWERERFDALRQSRDEVERPTAEGPESDPLTAEDAVVAAGPAAVEPVEAARGRKASALNDAQVEAMLIQLGADEPKVDEHLKTVGVFGSAVAMFFGACMLFWGFYAFMTARGNFAGVVGSLIVLGMGAVFGGIGLWFGWRVTNRGE